jgi:hypothetical protein
MTAPGEPRAGDLDAIRAYWRAMLTRPAHARDRHNIANLVGVNALRRALGIKAHLTEIEQLMRAVGLAAGRDRY